MPPIDAETLRQRVASFPFWYHRIQLPGGVVTPGWAPVNPNAYGIENISGKRVLDVGAWDGYWTFDALKRGAREVVAIDDFSDFLDSLKEDDRKAWQTFDLCREVLGYDAKQCQRHEMKVYDVTEERLGRFDTVFFFGTLYHLRYPLLALDKLSTICDGDIFIESAILNDFSAYRGWNKGYGTDMVMEFYPDSQYGKNDSNWWVPTLNCLMHMTRAAGFTHNVTGWKLMDNPTDLGYCRGFVTASKPPR